MDNSELSSVPLTRPIPEPPPRNQMIDQQNKVVFESRTITYQAPSLNQEIWFVELDQTGGTWQYRPRNGKVNRVSVWQTYFNTPKDYELLTDKDPVVEVQILPDDPVDKYEILTLDLPDVFPTLKQCQDRCDYLAERDEND